MDLKTLERRFGSRFIKIIEDSPTLKKDLRALFRLGTEIHRWNGKTGAYSRSRPQEREGSTIVLGSNDSAVTKAIHLAHEAYHVLYGLTPDSPDPRKISRERYISMGIQEETRAFIHQVKVARELWDSGNHALSASDLHVMLVYETGGYADMRLEVMEFESSVNGKKYPVSYGDVWDQALKERRKLLRDRRARRAQTRSGQYSERAA